MNTQTPEVGVGDFICWFMSQMDVIACAGPGTSQVPKTLSQSATWVPGAGVLRPFLASFSDTLARSWDSQDSNHCSGMICQRCRWQLSLLCHNAHMFVFFFFFERVFLLDYKHVESFFFFDK